MKPDLPITGRYTAKDQRKWNRAGKFIGRGSPASSTQQYALALGELANSGQYLPGDQVFVSAEGNRRSRLDPDFQELQRAVDAGAVFITDPEGHGEPGSRLSPYNLGERQVAAFLQSAGYTDDGSGTWTRATTPGSSAPVSSSAPVASPAHTTSFPRRAGQEVFPGGPRWEIGLPITVLAENEVFIFGSNRDGFHGMGAAGQAMRGNPDRDWRNDPAFMAAKNSLPGDSRRIGLWTVYGVGRGPARGRSGRSYAVQTTERAGKKRSTPLTKIAEQLSALCTFAAARPQLNFLVTPVGEKLAGYSASEMSGVWQSLLVPLPENLRFIQIEGS